MVLETIPKAPDTGVLVVDAGHRQFGCPAKGHNIGHALGAATATALLVAADNIGLKLGPALDIQHSDAFGGMKLVGAERQEIHPQLANIHLEFAGHLNGVGVAEYSLAAAQGGDFLDGEEHAGLVVGHHDRNDGCIGPDRALQEMQVERTIAFHRQIGHLEAPFLEICTKIHIGAVLDGGGHHVPFTARHQCAMDGRIVRLGSAAREGHFLRIGVDQGCHGFPGLLHMTMDLRTKGIGAGRIGPQLA